MYVRRITRVWIILLATITLIFHSISFASMYGRTLCKNSGFSCKHVKRGQSWYSLWPNEHDRDIAMRVNRMNTQIYPGIVLAVPNDIEKIDIINFAPFPQRIKPLQEKLVVIDPENIAWGAYDVDGTLVKWGPISAGADYCKDIDEPCRTHSGTFRVYSLGSSDCISHKFPLPEGGAPMPFCMYFNNGQALHGEPNGLPGYNASHGCVRLYVSDAEWLRYDFIEGPNSSNNYRGTKIIIEPYDSQQDSEEDVSDDYSSEDEQ